MSQQTTGSASGVGAIEGGPVTAVAGLALIINVVGLYAYTGVALCVFGYIALTLVLSSRAGSTAKNPGSAEAGNAVMIISWVVALVGGALVGAFHWAPYAHAAYAVLGVYATAVLIWLFGRAYGALWSWLFPMAGVAMLAAVMQLGAPPGADDMDEEESWTPVNVTAVDEAGQPIEGATVYLDLVQFWQSDPELDGERESWSKDETRSDGTAHMELQEDPRFKRLVIRVRREPFAGGFNEPSTIGAYVGYEEARLQTVLPAAKTPYAFQVQMAQRTHPDSAFLAVELRSPDSSDESFARSVKLLLTTEPELPWGEDEGAFDEDAMSANVRVRDVYVSGAKRVVFKLGRDLASRPLTLFVLQRDASRYDDAYLELGRTSIDAIALGDERVLSPIELPTGASASGSESIAEGDRDTDLR